MDMEEHNVLEMAAFTLDGMVVAKLEWHGDEEL